MSEATPSIAILGAGAIGCLCASALSTVADVRLICRRRDQADVINRDGLTMVMPDGVEVIRPVAARPGGAALDPADIVLICVKTYDTAAALAANAGLFGPATVAVTLQNGLGNDAVIGRFIPRERLIIGTIRGNSRRLTANRFRAGGPGAVRLGGGAAAETVAAIFRRAGFEAAAEPDIRPLIWDKLFINLAINPLTALHRVPNGAVISDPVLWDTAAAVIREAIAVAACEGMVFEETAVLDSVRRVAAATAADFSSMEQDLEHGRRTEIDALNGALTLLAARHRVAVPVNARLTEAVRRAETAGKI